MKKLANTARGDFYALLCGLGILGFSGVPVFALQNVTLAWDPSPGTDIVGYFVYYGTTSGTYTSKVSAGTSTNATVTGLSDSVTYYFVATAVNASGLESDPSNEVLYTAPGSTLPNQPPTLDPLTDLVIPANSGPQVVNLSGISSGETNSSQVLKVTAVSSNPNLIPDPTVIYSSPQSTGSLWFAPLSNVTGIAVITVKVDDGQSTSNLVLRSFAVAVQPPNRPPTLGALSNVVVDENSAETTVALSGISSGAADEFQTLTVTAISSNPGLIPNPIVGYQSPASTGSLTFKPAIYASGTAVITVRVNDGQLLNSVTTRSFSVTVNPVNQPPTLDAIGDLNLPVNSGVQTVAITGISTGAAGESQPLTVSASSSNPALIPAPAVLYSSPNSTGSLKFTPSTTLTGTAVITVQVNDGQALNNIASRSFAVTVIAGNQPPTLDQPANLTIAQNASVQVVTLTGIGPGAAMEKQMLTLTAISSNTGLIPNPTVSYLSPNSAGSLMFKPIMNRSGVANITVKINDGQPSNNIITRVFSVTVVPVNQPPTLNPLGNITLPTDAGPQVVALSGITSGASNEVQALTISAVSSSPSLMPNPTITYTNPATTGTLRFAPAAGLSGISTITVTVDDGQATNRTFSRSFVVTVGNPAEPPRLTLSPSNQVVTGASPLTLQSAAVGTGPLTYQWLRNGSPIPGATASQLSFASLSRADSGLYSVTVSNQAGQVTSTAATLRVLMPQRVSTPARQPDGSLLVVSRDSDGGSLTLSDLARFEIQVSDDLVNWQPLAAPLGLANGALIARDYGALTQPVRYYRVMETP